MQQATTVRRGRVLRRVLLAFIASLLVASQVSAQQDYVGKYDAYVGYAYFNSPKIDLVENGFHIQVGMNPKTWMAMGFDFSRASGDLTLAPDMLLTSLQQKLGAQLAQMAAAGMIPPNYSLSVKTGSVTETYALGPQLMIRRWKSITPFIRPSLGAIHETATPHPADPIAVGIVHQLSPSGEKQDWRPFYGVGWGFDINPSKHVGFRLQADFVHDYLFNDLLNSGRNTIRFSVGPTIHFGKNIIE